MTSKEYVLKLTEKIIPSMRYSFDEDFILWQKKAEDKLNELLGLPLIKPENDKFSAEEPYMKDGLSFMRFTFQSEEGYFVPCCLVKKPDLKEKAPLVICLQGHTTGMHVSLGESIFPRDEASLEKGQRFAIDAANEGAVAIAVEQRYMGVQGYKDMRGRPACIAASDDMDANQAIPSLLIGRIPIGERVWDVQRTIDVAFKYFGELFDSEKIVCLGNSGGGTATFYASCLEKRIALSVPSCAVCTFEESIMAMNHCICNYIPNIRKYFDMGDIGALMAPRKMIIVCGDEDPIFPLPGVKKSFDLIKKSFAHVGVEDKLRLVIGKGGHAFYPKDAWPVIHEML